MLDISVLQPVSWFAASIGVFIAAFYYALNLRETIRNRRATLTTTLIQPFLQEQGQTRFLELLNMEWKDFDDFYKKYDSTVNVDNWSKRMAHWGTFEVLGLQYRTGLLDVKTIYALCGPWVMNTWAKFRPVIEEYRKFDYGSDLYENWEYLANELAKIKAKNDPSWKGSVSHLKPDVYEQAFKVK